jgi:MATE family multidrug resistance protein
LPAFAVAEAGSVLSGQSVGAGSYGLVNRVARLALAITGVYTAVWSAVLAFGSGLLVSGFTPDTEVVSTATRLLHIAAVFQMFDAANLVARCALRGAGDVRYAAVVGVLTSWLSTPTLAWLLGHHYRLGAFGGWLGLCLEIIVGAAILWWRLERRGWLAVAERAHRAQAEPEQILPSPVPLKPEEPPLTRASA